MLVAVPRRMNTIKFPHVSHMIDEFFVIFFKRGTFSIADS